MSCSLSQSQEPPSFGDDVDEMSLEIGMLISNGNWVRFVIHFKWLYVTDEVGSVFDVVWTFAIKRAANVIASSIAVVFDIIIFIYVEKSKI